MVNKDLNFRFIFEIISILFHSWFPIDPGGFILKNSFNQNIIIENRF